MMNKDSWENRSIYKLSKKEVFYNAKVVSFLKTLNFEDLKASNAKDFFEWTKEKSIAFEKWFLSKNPDFEGDSKKLTDFFKGFVGEFFFYTLLTDIKTLVLKNSKGDRKLYTFRDVQLSPIPDFGVDLIAKVDCLNESKKSAIQVKFWNPESKEMIKNGYAAQIYGQAVCDKQIEPFESENVFFCWLGLDKKISPFLKENDSMNKHFVFVGMETLDENVNNKSKTFWESNLIEAFKNF